MEKNYVFRATARARARGAHGNHEFSREFLVAAPSIGEAAKIAHAALPILREEHEEEQETKTSGWEIVSLTDGRRVFT